MSASYPSSIKSWVDKQDIIDEVFAGDTNGAYAEIRAVETELMQVGYKKSARVATMQNGTLSTAFANGQTIDGVVLVTGDRILIKDQTNGAENGIYTVNASGIPTRAIDANSSAHMVAGLRVYIREGTVNAKGTWELINTGVMILDTTSLVFENKVMSHLADYVRQPAFAIDTGSVNAYIIATDPTPTAYVDGMSAYITIKTTNTGASTLDWNGLGVISIVTSKGAILTAGKLTAGGIVGVRYNATTGNFILLGEGGDYGDVTADKVVIGVTFGSEDGLQTGTYDKVYGAGDLLDITKINEVSLNAIPTTIPNVTTSAITRVKLSRDELHVFVAFAGVLIKKRLSNGFIVFSFSNVTIEDFTELANGEIAIILSNQYYLLILNADGTYKQSSPNISATYYPQTITADDNNNIYVYTSDKYIRKLDVSFNPIFSTLCTNTSGVRLTYQNGTLICGDTSSGHKVTFVDATTGTLITESVTPYTQACISVSENYVAIGMFSGKIYVYNRVSGSLINSTTLPTSDTVYGVSFDIDDSYYYVIQTGNSSGTAHLYIYKIDTISEDVLLDASVASSMPIKDTFLHPSDGKLYSGYNNSIAYHIVKYKINE